MTIDDLRLLIKNVFDNSTDIKEIESSVFDMIRLYEMTYNPDSMFIKDRYEYKENNYLTINCGCNPENGGNGFCNCIRGNNITYSSTNTTI
jgi:hypothetical protein